MMNKNQTIDLDIKNQVLSDYFLHRKNAIYLKNNGRYWPAVDEFRTLLSGIPLSEENYKEADKVIDAITKIEIDSHEITGLTEATRTWNKIRFRNYHAKMIFNHVLRKTTKILQVEGYLNIPLNNSNTKFFDPSNDKSSGTRFKK